MSYISRKRAGRPRARKAQKGVAAVEFAIVAFLFFFLMLTMIDFALFGFVNLTMQHAVREGARYAITGRADLDPLGVGDRRRAVIQKIRNNSMRLFDKVTSETEIVVTNSDGVAVAGFGSPGDTIVLRVNCTWPVINPFTRLTLPTGDYTFSVGATMRNEAFPVPGV